MSWRASPSRPAPPLTSSESDSYSSMLSPGSSSTPRSQRYRTTSTTSNASATSLLQRKMAEIEYMVMERNGLQQSDGDGRSVRSVRSTVTLTNNHNQGPGGRAASIFSNLSARSNNKGKGRERSKSTTTASSISSGRTARGIRSTTAEPPEEEQLELELTSRSSPSPAPSPARTPHPKSPHLHPSTPSTSSPSKRPRMSSEKKSKANPAPPEAVVVDVKELGVGKGMGKGSERGSRIGWFGAGAGSPSMKAVGSSAGAGAGGAEEPTPLDLNAPPPVASTSTTGPSSGLAVIPPGAGGGAGVAVTPGSIREKRSKEYVAPKFVPNPSTSGSSRNPSSSSSVSTSTVNSTPTPTPSITTSQSSSAPMLSSSSSALPTPTQSPQTTPKPKPKTLPTSTQPNSPTPTLRPPSSNPVNSSRRTSWFSRSVVISSVEPEEGGLGSVSEGEAPTPMEVDVAETAKVDMDIDMDKTPTVEVPNPVPVSSSNPTPHAGAPAKGGWRSLLTGGGGPSVGGGSAKVESESKPPAPGVGDGVPMDVDARHNENGNGNVEAKKDDADPADEGMGTVRARPPGVGGETLRPKRSSWWGWGGDVEPSPSSPVVAQEPTPAPLPAEPAPPSPATTVSTISLGPPPPPPPVAQPQPRTWRQTLWGETPEETLIRKQKEVISASRSSISSVSASEDESGEDGEETNEEMVKTVIPGPPVPSPRTLKHTSSWSFFSPRAPSTSSVPAPQTAVSGDVGGKADVPTIAQPIPAAFSGGGGERSRLPSSTSVSGPNGPNTNLLSRSPLVTNSLASSRASSLLSRETNTSSAPNSPRLGPTSDVHVKPLTGSIRGGSSPTPTIHPRQPDPPENLVLPTFNDSFLRPPRSFPLKKSKLTKAVSVVSAYLFSAPPTKEMEESTMGGMKDDPAERLPKSLEVVGESVVGRREKVRRVVTIGVHGWFPTPMVRSVTGEPTGTSVKFATMMHDSVQKYLEEHDVSSFNIQAIALEGEGQVEERVDKLFNQLVSREEWVSALSKADLVFLATHSQGSVVSTILLAKMIEKALVVPTRTHMLAMCAIAQGPFVYLSQSYTLTPYFQYVESPAARELFEFQDPDSAIATRFLDCLRMILTKGVKVTVVGSINDQVVPLYSALFSGISHPGILRAVYIDSAAFRTSDFLANLVVFACRLRNAGLKDHDLVYHVSEALAGALTGVGHSKIYDEEEVFNLAVRYQLEATSMVEAPTYLDPYAPSSPLKMSFNPRDRRNPYLLTWALRGIIEDPQVRELFTNELMALREAFEVWKPTTKVLKDVKLKLEGLRMLPLARPIPKREGKL